MIDPVLKNTLEDLIFQRGYSKVLEAIADILDDEQSVLNCTRLPCKTACPVSRYINETRRALVGLLEPVKRVDSCFQCSGLMEQQLSGGPV